ncbi:MAG: chorismate mutase [Spirochaetales bacterium]|nr:chorismate mutase [Spirochaetales bacterium]
MIRAIRGAVQLSADEKEIIKEKVSVIIDKMIADNSIDKENIVSIVFTVTDDIKSMNPAAALRSCGSFELIPLFCAKEPDVEGALPLTIRILLTTECNLSQSEVKHVYMDGAKKLRPDLEK